MHELSICQALIEQVEQIAIEHSAVRVTDIYLTIGPLSGVEPHLVEQAFPIAAAGTVAEKANLAIDKSPVKVYCESCGTETIVAANRLLCGECGTWQTQLRGGDEMILQRVELESNREE
ncbi:MAG: hydrogenase maturation nickel metallochaperone HypA [Gammaproteobacteria bacterium]|nr:hydrogenase maturation nickel metallochaperone HypA [Gammaproteobacteria bacterium]